MRHRATIWLPDVRHVDSLIADALRPHPQYPCRELTRDEIDALDLKPPKIRAEKKLEERKRGIARRRRELIARRARELRQSIQCNAHESSVSETHDPSSAEGGSPPPNFGAQNSVDTSASIK